MRIRKTEVHYGVEHSASMAEAGEAGRQALEMLDYMSREIEEIERRSRESDGMPPKKQVKRLKGST